MTILKLNLKALRSLSMYSVKFIATSRCPNHIYVYQQNLYALVVEAHLKLSIKGNNMHNPKFKIGDTVYIKKGERALEGHSFSSALDSPDSKIVSVTYDSAYIYTVECSSQRWSEDSLDFVSQRGKALVDIQNLKDYEKMFVEDFGTVLKLPTGYVFNSPVTFVPISVKETL